MLEEFIDVAGVALEIIPFRRFLGVTLGARIQRDHVKPPGELVDLRFEDVRGHSPAGDEHDGGGLGRAGVEIMQGDIVGGAKGFAFGLNGGAGGMRNAQIQCEE